MKNLILKSALILSCSSLLFSCGSQKNLDSSYYANPNNISTPQVPKETKREVREVDRLASQATDKLRAVGIGNDYNEKYARREAIRDAQATLAGYLERAIIEIVKEYNNNHTLNQAKVSEAQIEGYVETTVSQKISSIPIGMPEVYDLADGSVRVYVCVELQTETKKFLEDTYNNLTEKQILGIDYDKQKFIEDNMKTIEKLRNNLE